MAPPMQVAAPPKGSISVGWLWVSFLNRNSQSWSSPSTSHLILTVQALISSLSSRLVRTPRCLRAFAPMVATSIRQRGFSVRPVSARRAIYRSNASCTTASSIWTSSRMVPKVVWRQWSDQ